MCRTQALGGHVQRCADCGQERIAYNSCRNRHCPKCQALARARWLEREAELLLPVEYHHVVFTMPAEIAELAPGASSVGFRSGGFECRCCGECYRKGRMLTSLRIIYFIIFAFVVPMFLCGGGGFLAMKLFRADGAMPQGIGGVPGPEILDKFLGIASILCLLVWIAMPFVIGGMIRRRTTALLNPQLNARPLAISGSPRWGFLNRLSLHRRPPNSWDVFVPLS